MTRDQFVSLFFIALLIFVVREIFLIFAPFSHAIFWAGILAFGFYPIYDKIRAKMGRRTLAAACMTGLIVLLIVIPVVFIIFNITGQTIELYQEIASYIREGKLVNLIDQIRSYPFIHSVEEKILVWEPLKEDFGNWLLSIVRSIGNFSTMQAGQITKNFAFVLLNAFLTFILLFVFFRDGEQIYGFIYKVAPFENRNKKYIFGRINETFSAVIRGQLLTGLVQAVIAGITFWILGLPAPIFFGSITFIAAMIPIVGASFVWVPLMLYLMVSGDYTRGVALLIVGTLGISLVDNIMKPALIGGKAKLPYFLLFFGVMGGMKLYGLMGIFLAPVVLSLFFALIKIYQEKYLPQEAKL